MAVFQTFSYWDGIAEPVSFVDRKIPGKDALHSKSLKPLICWAMTFLVWAGPFSKLDFFFYNVGSLVMKKVSSS
jgi:hypothetical protein